MTYHSPPPFPPFVIQTKTALIWTSSLHVRLLLNEQVSYINKEYISVFSQNLKIKKVDRHHTTNNVELVCVCRGGCLLLTHW